VLSALANADAAILGWIASLPHPAWLTWVMVELTKAAAGGLVWLVIGGVLALAWRAPATSGAWRAALAVWLALFVANDVLKPIVARPRPFEANPAVVTSSLLRPTSSSLPSGHAASAVAGAYALALVWPRGRRVLWTLAALVALSRLYLGVHYPLDVVAGALVGWACAVFATAKTPCYTSQSLPRPA